MGMKADKQQTSADVEPTRGPLDMLRSLTVGTALYSKGPRTFTVIAQPAGILIRATDRSLIRVLTSSKLVPYEKFAEITDAGVFKSWLAQIDAEMDREIARAQ